MSSSTPSIEPAAPRPAVPNERARKWPALPPLEQWRPTYRTLNLYLQIVGKIRLARTPRVNEWWNVPLYLTARGLTTSPMPSRSFDRTFEIEFDFVDHELAICDSDGRERRLPLVPRTVADFYRELYAVLGAMGLEVPIWTTPVEIPHRTPFDRDTENGAYDADAASACFQALRRIEPVFETFRSRFRGKCSPVHLFWGSFDLAVTRFSGRRAPPRDGSIIERIAYDEEVISLGFWPGDGFGIYADDRAPVDATFYAYSVPEPSGFAGAKVSPEGARYDAKLKEFLLPYEEVRRSEDPASAILAFAQSTYDAAASLGGWPIDALAYS